MKKDNTLIKLPTLMFTFMKVGALTFGGGYAMIPIIQEVVAHKKKWISEAEILDVIVISESTPGPIAVNAATYVGYKVAGVLGAIFATLGLAIPSFIIIFAISFFYDKFMSWPVVAAIFKGLKVGVIILLFSAFFKLSKGVKKNLVSIFLFTLGLSLMLIFSFIDTPFKYLSLSLILFGILFGIVLTALSQKGEKK